MIQITVENNRGEKLNLTNNPDYVVTRVDGLNPSSANINTAVTATFDGSTFKSSRVNNRNIVIEIVLDGNVENSRINLYKYFKTKSKVTLYLRTASRDVYTVGYVETFECGLFERRQKAQVSLICPYPYFIDINTDIVQFSVTKDCFEFPFSIAAEGIPFSETIINSRRSIINNGDVESGLIIQLHATSTVLNPKIYNEDTGEYFILNVEMLEGDEIVINTNKGEKGVKMTVNGVTTNIINDIESGSTWFEIEPGDNIFLYTADEYPENLRCTFVHSDKYGGV